MNNGKVRIYELSRELNLDNKDILGICDQLNIAVKSHSSTITESEAERIRNASEKYSAQSASITKRSSNGERTEKKSVLPPSQSSSKQNPGHKQQILQIKHHSGSDGNTQQPGAKATVQSPQAPVKPISSAPAKPMPSTPSNLNRPVRTNQQDANSQPAPEFEPTSEQLQPTEAKESSPIKPTEVRSPEPPAKPVFDEALQPKPLQPLPVEKPVLKKVKVEQQPTGVKPAQKESRPGAASKPNHLKESATKSRAEVGALPSVVELQRPQKKERGSTAAPTSLREGQRPDFQKSPVQKPTVGKKPSLAPPPRKGGAGASGFGEGNDPALGTGTEEEEDIITPVAELELKRPAPRLTKVKNKNWEEEEEDPELANKSGKAGTKAKRRPLIVDEDDDDFASDLEELSESVVVSLSIARPPKPKSAAPVAATQAPASKNKKAAQKNTGESSRDNSRRRDQKVVEQRPEKIVLTGNLTVRELATALAVPETEIIKKLFFKGMAVNITQTLDIPTATMVAQEFEVEVETQEEQSEAIKVTEMIDAEDLENLQRRAPVVTIMGHVDHGKTTLLDAIRATKVAQGEAGGITQHIGAYHVDVEHNDREEQVVFLDTPGHEAFTAMRARGARVTDIAVLVVAADDGVRPQTVEAISHAKAAGVPIVVAINKIDKPDAQPDRVKQELTEYGLVAEEWGGDTIMVPVSAIQKENLDTLLEMILLVAEVEELQANPNRAAKGTVIEAHLDKAKGPTASLLVQNGTLRVGDTLVAGSVLGKIRAMIDDRGHRVEAAGPSWAVEVLGLSDVPAAGDEFEVFPNEKEARAIASQRSEQQRQSRLQQLMASRRVTLNSLSAQAQEGELKELNLVLKADVQGSLEAILGSLKQLPQNEVQVRVLFAAPGEVTETDVDLAAASGAVIVGFNTTLASGARQAADQAGVDVREYNIIYKLLDDIQAAMEGLLEPEQVEEALGQVEVRAVFPVGRGAVAGCYVLSGKAVRNCRIRVRRGSKVVYEGALDSLKRMKDDAKEVNAGFECGVGVDKFNDWSEGDIIETYQMVSKRRTLSPV